MQQSIEDEGNVKPQKKQGALSPFRRAVLRGMGILMPPLLTVVLFIWAWSMIDSYVLVPIETSINFVIRKSIAQSETGIPPSLPVENIKTDAEDPNQVTHFFSGGSKFVPLNNGKWIPEKVITSVRANPGNVSLATATPDEVYRRYVDITYLQRWKVIPIFLLFFIGLLYLLGRFMAFGVGRITWNGIEALIRRLPIIRNVYSSVKQVTDFVFSEQEVQFTRVVAVQYPRRGIWSVGFVTGESMLDIKSAANEPVLSVLMPTSPMPMTGFTVTVRKSETIDLDISIDQAIQFVVSCGVVVPPNQLLALQAGQQPKIATPNPLLESDE